MMLGNNLGMHLLHQGITTDMIPYTAINVHWILPILFIVLMIMFYVTSSDSQSYAMDCLISKGSKTPIVYRKILWVFLEVLFVTVLLLCGGGTTSAIQGLSFLFVPLLILFAIINLVLICSLVVRKRLTKSVLNNADTLIHFNTEGDLGNWLNKDNNRELYYAEGFQFSIGSVIYTLNEKLKRNIIGKI